MVGVMYDQLALSNQNVCENMTASCQENFVWKTSGIRPGVVRADPEYDSTPQVRQMGAASN